MELLKFENRQFKFLGDFGFIILAILASVFFLERTIILDASFQGLSVIYKGDFAFQYNRFGALFTQAFPLLGVKLGLPLKGVLFLYSLGFILFPFLVYLILTKWLKNEKMGLVLFLFFILLVSHTFFWIQSELLQACTLLVFFFGVWISLAKIPFWSLPFWYAWIFLILITHPLAFIPFGFIWLYFLLDERYPNSTSFYSIPLATGILFYLKNTFFKNSYDTGTTELAKNVKEQWHNFFNWPSNLNFIENCVSDYFFFPILLLLVTAFLAWHRKFLKLILVLSFTTAYLILINGTFWWGGAEFHLESFYQVLTIFLALPLVFDALANERFKKWMTFILPIFVIIKLLHIAFFVSPFYSERLETNKALLQKTTKYEGKKFLAYEKDLPVDKLLQTWGTPCETLLLSAMQSPDSTRTIVVASPSNEKLLLDNLHYEVHFLTAFGPIPYYEINESPYFNFRDTAQYRILREDEIQLTKD